MGIAVVGGAYAFNSSCVATRLPSYAKAVRCTVADDPDIGGIAFERLVRRLEIPPDFCLTIVFRV